MVERVTLYRDPATVVDAEELGDWLAAAADVTVEIADRFLADHVDEEMAERFAGARVVSPYDRETGSTVHGLIRYEERALEDSRRTGGIVYDGLALQRAINDRLPDDELALDHLHIVILARHLGTWGEHDGRWHKRIAVLGQPTLISVSGLAEAPAKPESYYQLQQQHAALSGDRPPREILDEEIDEDVLLPEDPRTTEALKGYLLAGVHLLRTGEAFCEEPECRLYNGHRHGEVIRAQLEPPEFCETHAARYG